MYFYAEKKYFHALEEKLPGLEIKLPGLVRTRASVLIEENSALGVWGNCCIVVLFYK